MKSFLLLIFLLCLSAIHAQPRKVDDILAQREQLRPVYNLKTNLFSALVLNMSYGNNELISETDRKLLAEAQVVSIDLVFTDFPKGQDLKALNRSRIEKIQRIKKELVSDANIQWRVIRQTACTNEAEAKVLFHGVVIHYRPPQNKETVKVDIAYLEQLPSTGDSLKALVSKERPYGLKMTDTTVIAALSRNKQWKDMLIVCDMTGSMSPYSAQLLVWFQLKMKDKRVRQVVFFNDGDNKTESAKVVGKIGGIYMAKANTYEEILTAAQTTIKNGGGGDAPENNCEAVLRGIDSVPQAKDIILIADNLANIKDISLLEQIKVPVHVVLCGTEYYPLNPQYLTLARVTGGSVHTMKQDLNDLAKLNEGETVKVGNATYQVVGGQFIQVATR